MSIETLFVHPVTVVRPATTTDRYGNTVKDWDAATESSLDAWVHQSTGREVRDGREAQVGEWVAFLPTGTEIDGGDRLVYGDVTFEVDGPPRRSQTPRGEHHVEASLLVVTG